ncbi:nucleotidyl transferase AbiEii/AbiGii toxin family protein [Acidobacteria bacterium AB60]|nr:nucleotidyl transferase AbiEii/AbiGii toxin family protein [Acidobacteria bacterium AB60]
MANHDDRVWHREVIPSQTESTLHLLRSASLLDDFYLAGGTGLALQFGHRLSLDLDFFSPTRFQEDALVQRIQTLAGFALASKASSTLHTTIQTTKVSFLGYAYPILYRTNEFMGVPVADPRDIACMKVSAIASRGTRRDFMDLYFCAREFGLSEILGMFDRKYAQANTSRIHVLKSLTYFGDAEKDPMPHMLVPIDWERVKRFFIGEVPRLL